MGEVKEAVSRKDTLFGEVIILRRSRALSEPFDYLIPEDLRNHVTPGVFVRVPFGATEALGLIVRLKNHSLVKNLKSVIEVIEHGPRLPGHALELSLWMSDYYLCGFSECLALFLPPGFSPKLVKVVHLLKSEPRDNPLVKFLAERGGSAPYPLIESYFGKSARSVVSKAKKSGIVSIHWQIPRPRVHAKEGYDVSIADREIVQEIIEKSRSRKLKAALELLLRFGKLSFEELRNEVGLNLKQLEECARKGAVFIEKRRVIRTGPQAAGDSKEVVHHTEKQKEAIARIKSAIDDHRHAKFMLHGVTGSGKTEVYLQTAAYAVSKGRSVIYLIPEISLTPQTVAWVERMFGDRVAVFHSAMKATERLDEWLSLQEGLKKIVVGPRSALFSPVENVGLIIVDEEHEPAYKQESSPYYDARTVAEKLGEISSAPVVFGSATPSVERMYRVSTGEIEYLSLPEKVVGKDPVIELVDLRKEKKVLSKRLKEEILSTIEKRDKVILFLNRRGYAVILMCWACGNHAVCPNCSIALRYHADEDKLICHYCDSKISVPSRCPECGSSDLKLQGTGTQKIEEELSGLSELKKASVLRLDSDITRKGKARQQLIQFIAADAGVMVGTQMIAKGLHFPDVTLVGVVNADVSLHLPDYRAEERTFQLLMQVFGRTGRGNKTGKVIVQTWNPDREVIKYAIKGDYQSFFNKELKIRKALDYPPFSKLLRIVFSSGKREKAMKYAEKFASELKGILEDEVLIGPTEAPLAKLRGKFRFHIILKYKNNLSSEVNRYLRKLASNKVEDISVIIDVDPVSLM